MSKSSKVDIKLIAWIVVLSIIYLAMLIGLSVDDISDYFIAYIPVLYLVTFIILLSYHKGWSINFLLFILITFVGIFLIQLVNVKTGIVYGKLKYGTILGPKILDVPLLAVFNRFVLIYCVGLLIMRLKMKHDIISSLIGAFILVLISLITEPIAISLKFRAWTEHMSPLHNYGSRFITSFIFLSIFNAMNFPKKNKMSLPVLFIEIIFFILINVIVI